MVGLVLGSISKVTTSYPSSRSRLETDPVPENKSKALSFLRTLFLAVCPTGLSAILGEFAELGGVTGEEFWTEKEKGKRDDEVEVDAVACRGGVDDGVAEGVRL